MASRYPDVSERLSNTFGTWHIYYCLFEAEVQAMSKVSPIRKEEFKTAQCANQLAKTILDQTVQNIELKDWNPHPRFKKVSSTFTSLEFYNTFPQELFMWNRLSRRAFQIPHSLEAMLACATFPEMKWSDVLWPFESFFIGLEKPLKVLHHGNFIEEFDSFMITRLHNGTEKNFSLAIRWFQSPPRERMRLGMTMKETKRFRKSIRDGDIRRATDICQKAGRRMHRLQPTMYGSQRALLDVNFEEDSLRLEPRDLCAAKEEPWDTLPKSLHSFFECLSVTLKIAVGWMLYLETLSQDTVEWKSGQTARPRVMSGGVPSIITEPDKICTVVGKGRIDPSEVTSETSRRCSKGFVRPHWRRAHYRRPAGSSPDAPKSQRVPPVLVRADLVPLYGIVGGTTTVVIPED